jgi:hypothetical protein
VDSPFKSANFEAPLPQKIGISDRQSVVITGDTGTTVTVVLGAVDGASAASLAATLQLTPKVTPPPLSDAASVATPANPHPASAPPPPRPGVPAPTAPMTAKAVDASAASRGEQVTLAAQALALDPVAHTLTMTFHSPAKAGVTALWPDPVGSPVSSTLAITQVNCSDDSTLCPEFTPVNLPVKLVAAAAGAGAAGASGSSAPAGFTLVDGGNTLLVDDTGAVSIPITINSVSPGITVNLNLTGAAVVSLVGPGGTAILLSAQGYVLPVAGQYTLTLSNVPPGAMVTVTATSTKADPAGGPKPVTVGTTTHTFVAVAKPRVVVRGD